MLNKIIISASICLLSACSTPDIRYEVKEVKVPIPVACQTPHPDKPDYHFEKLSLTASLYDKVKALLADRRLYQSYTQELDAALKSCKE